MFWDQLRVDLEKTHDPTPGLSISKALEPSETPGLPSSQISPLQDLAINRAAALLRPCDFVELFFPEFVRFGSQQCA